MNGHVWKQIDTHNRDGWRLFSTPGDMCAACSDPDAGDWVPVAHCRTALADFIRADDAAEGLRPSPPFRLAWTRPNIHEPHRCPICHAVRLRGKWGPRTTGRCYPCGVRWKSYADVRRERTPSTVFVQRLAWRYVHQSISYRQWMRSDRVPRWS
jgi:hypothetical protein